MKHFSLILILILATPCYLHTDQRIERLGSGLKNIAQKHSSKKPKPNVIIENFEDLEELPGPEYEFPPQQKQFEIIKMTGKKATSDPEEIDKILGRNMDQEMLAIAKEIGEKIEKAQKSMPGTFQVLMEDLIGDKEELKQKLLKAQNNSIEFPEKTVGSGEHSVRVSYSASYKNEILSVKFTITDQKCTEASGLIEYHPNGDVTYNSKTTPASRCTIA